MNRGNSAVLQRESTAPSPSLPASHRRSGPAAPSPRRPVLLDSADGDVENTVVLDESTWQRARDASRKPGPAFWTAHCGGAPLSSHAVWGSGDRTVWPCPRHSNPSAARWAREWPVAAVEQAFGPGVRALSLESPSGTWALRADSAQGSVAFSFDAAHPRLAPILGWNALPSPADRVSRTPSGYRVDGAGSGHRVGLCLGD